MDYYRWLCSPLKNILVGSSFLSLWIKFLFFWDKLPRVQLLDHMVAVCLVLQDVANLPYRQLWILHSHQQRPTHPVFRVFIGIGWRHCVYFSRSVVVPHGSFNLHSLMSDDIEHVFLLFNCCLCVFFYEISLYVFLPIFSNFLNE